MTHVLKMFQIDAFSSTLFGGNPAAVCVLEEWMDTKLMQQIASENNLSETAFVKKGKGDFEIRWFTPQVEVALCGHATLASAFVLFRYYDYHGDTILFHSRHSGLLSVSRNEGLLTLDFPKDQIKKVSPPETLLRAFSKRPLEVYKGKTDYLLLYDDQNDIIECEPNHDLLKKSEARGIMITAPGKEVDFVSRFFAPGAGIEEDPVTGSAHTTLTPLWSQKLGKTRLRAQQLSKRKGELLCELHGERVKISGKAVLYMIGEIFLDDFVE